MSPILFNRKLLARRRWQKIGEMAKYNFLYHEIATRLVEDLSFVNKNIDIIVDLGSQLGELTIKLSNAYPSAMIVGIDQFAVPGLAYAAIAAEADVLPLANNCADLIISNLALHLVNDIPGCLVQIRRALLPDGLFMASLLGGNSLMELRQCLLQAELEVAGGSAARLLPLPDFASATQLLQRAGFALPVTHQETMTIEMNSPWDILRHIRGMGLANFMHSRTTRPLHRRIIHRAMDMYAKNHSRNGKIAATAQIIYLTGWAPADSQPKPLRPGSATNRLAEALQTVEYKTGDRAGDN